MTTQHPCPKCSSEHAYFDGNLWNCPECAHEWSAPAAAEGSGEPNTADTDIRDANGNILQNGDTVTVIRDLKVKGASSTLKAGTKVKNIRLVDGPDSHNIACKIDGFGSMNLKSEVVKKVL